MIHSRRQTYNFYYIICELNFKRENTNKITDRTEKTKTKETQRSKKRKFRESKKQIQQKDLIQFFDMKNIKREGKTRKKCTQKIHGDEEKTFIISLLKGRDTKNKKGVCKLRFSL